MRWDDSRCYERFEGNNSLVKPVRAQKHLVDKKELEGTLNYGQKTCYKSSGTYQGEGYPRINGWAGWILDKISSPR